MYMVAPSFHRVEVLLKAQQAMLNINKNPHQGPSKKGQDHHTLLANDNNRNQCGQGGTDSVQVLSVGWQHYACHPLRRNSRNRGIDPNVPTGSGRYYSSRSSGGCGGPNATPGKSDDSPPDSSYGAGSDITSSSEFGR